MTRWLSTWGHGWWREPIRMDLALTDVMVDLEPGRPWDGEDSRSS